MRGTYALFIRNINTYRMKDVPSSELIMISCKRYCWNQSFYAVVEVRGFAVGVCLSVWFTMNWQGWERFKNKHLLPLNVPSPSYVTLFCVYLSPFRPVSRCWWWLLPAQASGQAGSLPGPDRLPSPRPGRAAGGGGHTLCGVGEGTSRLFTPRGGHCPRSVC